MELHFDPKCRILVGINESGKTNILDALNLLDKSEMTTRRDVREPGLRETPVTEAYVRFVFNFTDEEIAEIIQEATETFLSDHYSSPIIRKKGVDYTVDEFCKSQQGLYRANLITGKKSYGIWGLGTDAKIKGNWKRVSAACPSGFTLKPNSSEEVQLKFFTLVDTQDFPDIPEEYLEEATVDDFRDPITRLFNEKTEKLALQVLYWNYDESNLLPPKINLDHFCQKPDVCLPLKRMFQLYEISDIQAAVIEAKAGSSNALPNLLRRVASKTSRHFHRTWKEYDAIKFSLATDGPDLVARIEDKSNHYELSQRSDGFKRFVTFLLMVSAEDASNLMKDRVLLIDEPEIGLHPSGARYLLEELIKISANNYVVFSTHSIFMIDSGIIKRHLIVKKDNEITEIEEVSESNIQDEEVIYKSLGYSMFSNLKERNLIFEGWKDKRLFEIALSRIPADYDELKQLKKLGHCFAHGVKNIKNITPLFEAGLRKCLILTDSDSTAKEHQKEYQQNRGFGLWKRYDEILPHTAAITGEDFIKAGAFREPIAGLAEKHSITALPIDQLEGQGGKLHAIRQWLSRNRVEQKVLADAIQEVKDSVFSNLKISEITDEYFDYLKVVSSLATNF